LRIADAPRRPTAQIRDKEQAMRQIVTGLFETYDDARRAQDALLLNGFAVTDIELPVPGTYGATDAGDHRPGGGLLAGVERLLSSLFTSRPLTETPPASTEDEARAASLRFALQRGAVLIGVRVFDDAHATVARETLTQQQALQIDVHTSDWQPGAGDPDSLRERSLLDELGLGGLTDALRQQADALRHQAAHRPPPTVPDDATLRTRYDGLSDAPAAARPDLPERPADDPAVTALTPAQPVQPPEAQTTVSGSAMTPLPSPSLSTPVGAPSAVPDEFLEYEEDFRGHHATRYQQEGAPFERYQDAYRYGAALAQDTCNQGRAWVDIEPEARRGWETMVAGITPRPSWEQARDAVRHGWERACAQGGGA
jgi:hypothetical protein